MSIVQDDVWTCPDCNETTRGTARARRTQQRAHAKRHGKERGDLVEQARHTAPPLSIPAAPKTRRRVR